MQEHQVGSARVPTMDVGLGGFTGRPFALTGARVPALSAFLCSRWIFLGCQYITSAAASVWYSTYSVLLGDRHGGGSSGYVGVEARGNVLHIARESAITLIRVSLSA
jgi:hypothetical protein